MGKTSTVPQGMYEVPDYLANAIRVISDIAQSVRPAMGDLTELGHGEVYSLDESWGLAAWCEDDEVAERPQFAHTPLDIEVIWHQRITRACFVNRVVTREEVVAMLYEILSDMKEGKDITYVVW